MKRAGFSLVEVVIVAAIVAGIGIPLLALVLTGSREGALSEDFLFAEALASSLMEEWNSHSFADLNGLVPHHMTTDGAEPAVKNKAGAYHKALKVPAGFAAELTIARVKDGLLSLEVTVTWQAPHDRAPRKFPLLCLRTNPTLAQEARWSID